MRRRPRHLAGALAWTLARCRARRAERPQMTVPGLVSAVAGEASDAASRAAGHVGTVSRAITDATSAAARTRAIAALCEELNRTGTRFPGSSLRLRYAIRGAD